MEYKPYIRRNKSIVTTPRQSHSNEHYNTARPLQRENFDSKQ